MTAMRPPRKSSVVVAPARPARTLGFFVVGDDMADAGLGENIACLPKPSALDQDAPGQGSDRALKHAHIEIGDDEVDPRLLQQCADIGQKHLIVRTQQFLHGLQSLVSLASRRSALTLAADRRQYRQTEPLSTDLGVSPL